MPPDVFAPLVLGMTVIIGAAVTLILRGPLGRALGRRLEGGAAASPDLVARLAELETRLAECEHDRARLLELEERVDFAERLLAGHDPVRGQLER